MMKIFRCMKKKTLLSILAVLISYSAAQIVFSYIPTVFGKVVDAVSRGSYEISLILAWILIAGGCTMLMKVMDTLFINLKASAYKEILERLLGKIFFSDMKYLKKSPEYYADTAVIRVNEALDIMDPTLSVGFIQFVKIFSIMFFVFMLDKITGLVTLAAAIAIPLAYHHANKWYIKNGGRYMEMKKDFLAWASEDITAKTEIDNLQAHEYEERKIAEFTDNLMKENAKVNLMSFFNYFVLVDIFRLSYEFFVLVWVVYSFLQHNISLGIAISLITYSRIVSEPIQYIGAVMETISRAVVSSKTVSEILNLPELPGSEKGTLKDGSVKLKNVSWHVADKRVLDGFNLEIDDGQIVLIRGKTGAGKTTLLRLISADTVPDEGRVVVGNVSTENIQKEMFWEQISFVVQRNVLLPLSILENITYGLHNYQDRAKELLNKLGLDYLDLNRILKSREDLSGGETRAINLIKSLLKDSPVYLFDEPFAGMDEQLKKRAIDVLKDMTKGKTVFLVTHDEEIFKLLKDKAMIIEFDAK